MRRKWMISVAVLLLAAVLCACGTDVPPETQPTENTTPATEATAAPAVYEPRSVGHYYITTPEGFVVAPGAAEELRLESLNAGDASRITMEIADMRVDVRDLTDKWLRDVLSQDTDSFSVQDSHELFVHGCYGQYMAFSQEVEGRQEAGWAIALQTEQGMYVFSFIDATADGRWGQVFLDTAATLRFLEPGEHIQLQPQGLTEYILPCGLALQAEAGMQEVPGGGYAAVLQGDYSVIMVLEDPKQDATAGLTLEEYAQSVARIHDLDAFKENAYGNLVSVYRTHSQTTGLDYFYYLTVKETEGSFFLCQMVCQTGEYTRYRDQFDIWATTITAAPETAE